MSTGLEVPTLNQISMLSGGGASNSIPVSFFTYICDGTKNYVYNSSSDVQYNTNNNIYRPQITFNTAGVYNIVLEAKGSASYAMVIQPPNLSEYVFFDTGTKDKQETTLIVGSGFSMRFVIAASGVGLVILQIFRIV